MTPSALLSRVTGTHAIRSHFAWHMHQGVALRLMVASSDGHTLAHLTGMDAANQSLQVVCTGVRDVAPEGCCYALIGTTANGANFLASGRMQAVAGTSDCFTLSFPTWIDTSQSRDSYRSPVPAGHFVHFSSSDPHLNDIVCPVHNVSLGGLAVVWDRRETCAAPLLGALSDEAVLYAGDKLVSLGRLRVSHITPHRHHLVLGLKFERDVPRSFGALVLDAQRAQAMA